MQLLASLCDQHLVAIKETPQNKRMGASSFQSIYYSVNEPQTQYDFDPERNPYLFPN